MDRLIHRALLLALVGGALSACTTVEPWQRDITARRSMQLDANPTVSAAHDHIYFSKEAATGGRSIDGGGCGCNY
jgi:hypothetical protein